MPTFRLNEIRCDDDNTVIKSLILLDFVFIMVLVIFDCDFNHDACITDYSTHGYMWRVTRNEQLQRNGRQNQDQAARGIVSLYIIMAN